MLCTSCRQPVATRRRPRRLMPSLSAASGKRPGRGPGLCHGRRRGAVGACRGWPSDGGPSPRARPRTQLWPTGPCRTGFGRSWQVAERWPVVTSLGSSLIEPRPERLQFVLHEQCGYGRLVIGGVGLRLRGNSDGLAQHGLAKGAVRARRRRPDEGRARRGRGRRPAGKCVEAPSAYS